MGNYDGEAEDNVDEKMNLYFTYESHDTLKSFTLFITVKTIAKLNPEHSSKFEIKILKISHGGSHSPDKELATSHCLQRTAKNVPRIITHVNSDCSAH